jgi:cytochrome c oxidase subunit 2
VFVLSILSYQLFAQMQAPKNNELALGVKGQRYFWQFSYPYQPFSDLTKEQNDAAASNMVSRELHLPVDRPIVMNITSIDVLHSFYIPEFRMKQDAIPGKTTNARFTPSQPGNYNVVCTELCGDNHAGMHAPVIVQSASDYDTWVSTLRNNAKTAALDPRRADRGKQLMQNKYPCGSCHALTDAGLTSTVGPKLDGVETRAATNQDNRLAGVNGATTDDKVAQYLRTSIITPGNYLVPGYGDLMPKNFGDPTVMPEDDREAIVNYLLTQK